jgi:hypothetical protein
MRQLNEQIAQVEGELEQARARIIANADSEYQASVGKVTQLRAAFESSRAATMQQNEAAVNYKMIQQTVETNKKLLDDILQRSKEVDLGAAAIQSPVTLKNRADVPGGPSGPDRSRWILMAVAGSLFAGVALAFGREYFDQTIRSIEDIDRVVRLPSLGVIRPSNPDPDEEAADVSCRRIPGLTECRRRSLRRSKRSRPPRKPIASFGRQFCCRRRAIRASCFS